MFKKYDFRRYDFKLVLLMLAVSILGIMVIGSAKESVQDNQIYGLIFGFVCMVIVSLIDYTFILKFSWLWYIIGVALLVMVHFWGVSVNNATRWVEIFGIQFQPSEVVKIILILFYAQFIMKHRESINSFLVLASMVLLLGPPLFL